MKPDGKTGNVRRNLKPCFKRGRSWNRKNPSDICPGKKEPGDVPPSTEITGDGVTGRCTRLMEVYKFTEVDPGGREVD